MLLGEAYFPVLFTFLGAIIGIGALAIAGLLSPHAKTL
jgi:hypothetical protein